MNKQRQQAYLNLIQSLLNCPSGKEPAILVANQELVDAGFVQMLEAENFLERVNEIRLNWLRDLATQLDDTRNLEATVDLQCLTENDMQVYFQFLTQVILVTVNSNGDKQLIYPFLAQNINKLDDIFAYILRHWRTVQLGKVRAHAESLAQTILIFCNLIQEFPLGNKASNIEIAISGYKLSLTACTRSNLPKQWAAIQNNLGLAYAARIRGKKSVNLELAIAFLQNSLEVRTFDAFPEDWAQTQTNLGDVYRRRIQEQRANNLEQAIIHLQNALTVYTFEHYAYEWAITQNNLGLVYTERVIGEYSDNLEQAITNFQNALQVRTFENCPPDWALTQNNLSGVYIRRVIGKQSDNLELAIIYLQNALTIYTFEDFPVEWATMQNNLGEVFRNRIIGDPRENLEQAIIHFQNSLRVRNFESSSPDWAQTQNNLGLAYINRMVGEHAENLEQAIIHLQNALTVYTFEDFPIEWATTQNNLGEAFRNRIIGEPTENLGQAITCYQKSLIVRNFEAFPKSHAETLSNLGIAYQSSNLLTSAYNTFKDAIDTVDYLRGEIISGDEAKQKLAEEWNQLYLQMVEVCLSLSKDTEAIEYIERNKTRILSELLATRQLFPEGKLPEAVQKELQKLRLEIDIEKRRLAVDKQPDYSHINQLRQRYNELYPLEHIQFQQIQNLIDDGTAIIQWYIFGDCFRTFIITRHRPEPIIWQSSNEDLKNLHKWRDDYLAAYYALKNAKTETEQEKLEKEELEKQWENSIKSRLQQLAEILHINQILEKLSNISPNINQLVLVPHLYLHILPLHGLPISLNAEKYLFDLFPRGVKYAPSCQILQQVQQQQRQEFQHFFAIQNPTPDLYLPYDKDLGIVRAISKQFQHPYILKRGDAKKSMILQHNHELLTTNNIFFFCHGDYKQNSPLDSGLQLADENLTLADIITHFSLKNCRLVTLSACETGVTNFDKGSDEYIGLPNGFLLAGSTNVVSSLWSVKAVATALLMITFYEELQKQPNIAIALNTAQRWLRDTTTQEFQERVKTLPVPLLLREKFFKYFENQGANTKPFESPYYWSAFCIIGKGV